MVFHSPVQFLLIISMPSIFFFPHPLQKNSNMFLQISLRIHIYQLMCIFFFYKDEDETDSPAKANRSEMSQQFMAQLEDKVSVRFVIFGWNDCEFWLMIGLLDPRLGGLWASLTWVHCVHSVLWGNTWLPQFPSSPTTVIIREVLECGFLSKIYFLGYEPHTQWFLQNLGQALVGCATGFLTRIHSRLTHWK